MRLLFWLALIVLVIAAVRSQWRAQLRAAQRRAAEAQGRMPAGAGQDGAEPAEAMACCAHCQLHFPASEAIHAGGETYCSPEHVGLPARNGAP